MPVVPVKDSIRRVIDGQTSSQAEDRSVLRAVQTPQCFDLATLKAAFDTPFRSEFTDDANVFEAAGHSVELCEGDPWNVKVTTPKTWPSPRPLCGSFGPFIHEARTCKRRVAMETHGSKGEQKNEGRHPHDGPIDRQEVRVGLRLQSRV